MHTKLNIIPVLLFVIGLILMLRALPGFLYGQHGAPAVVAPGAQTAPAPADVAKRIADLRSQLDDLTKAREVLKDRQDSISRDAATAQWLLAIVVGRCRIAHRGARSSRVL